jgi:K+-transporting ATPase ATPase B chain
MLTKPPSDVRSGDRRPALLDAFASSTRGCMIRNPVMFVVEVGAPHDRSCTATLWSALFGEGRRPRGLHPRHRALALVHRAVRQLRRGDGRGPRQGQADALRKARKDATRQWPAACAGRASEVRSPRRCARATSSSCEAGDVIPADGEVIEGIASVDEAAITGESAPVIRESGGDRSAVTGGTRVISDRIVVRITPKPGPDLPRPHDRDGRGRQAPEDAERDRARHPALRADAHLPARA